MNKKRECGMCGATGTWVEDDETTDEGYGPQPYFLPDSQALQAEVERLTLCLEPGTAPQIVHRMFEEADRLGIPPPSSRHALTGLTRELERLREALGWVQRQINGCIEYAAYIDTDRSTVGSGALLADLRAADDQIEKALARQVLTQGDQNG